MEINKFEKCGEMVEEPRFDVIFRWSMLVYN
jgi:hypothetical protein